MSECSSLKGKKTKIPRCPLAVGVDKQKQEFIIRHKVTGKELFRTTCSIELQEKLGEMCGQMAPKK